MQALTARIAQLPDRDRKIVEMLVECCLEENK